MIDGKRKKKKKNSMLGAAVYFIASLLGRRSRLLLTPLYHTGRGGVTWCIIIKRKYRILHLPKSFKRTLK